MSDLRAEAARLTAVSDQTVAAITHPDICLQNESMLVRILQVADLLADAGVPAQQVVGQIAGESGALLANWLVRRHAEG